MVEWCVKNIFRPFAGGTARPPKAVGPGKRVSSRTLMRSLRTAPAILACSLCTALAAQEAMPATIDASSLSPVQGYRFVVSGAFAQAGRQTRLTERFLDGRTGKESPKFYRDLDYDALVALTCAKDPIVELQPDGPHVSPLVLEGIGQVFGFAYVRNEGDLDGDGRDELSYVVDYADWSALNRCVVVGYRRGRWKELASFAIHESWLPELPDFQQQFWLFGVAGRGTSPGDRRTNRRLEQRLAAFPGFLRRVAPGRIRVREYDLGDVRTRVLRLAR